MNDFLSFRTMITPVIIQILFWVGVALCFIFGLGVTQMVDGISAAMAEGSSGGIQWVGLGFNLVIAGFVVLFGWLARQRLQWAFLVGMILYAMDGLILLLAGDWLGAIFHGWVLFGMFTGLRACRELERMDADSGRSMHAA